MISGDRHLRQEPSGRLGAAPFRAATVLVRAGPGCASTPAGQHLLHMTVNLLARQFGVVGHILIDVPATPLLERVVLGVEAGKDLPHALMDVVTRVGGREVTPVRGTRAERPDVAVLIGPDLHPDECPCAAVAVVADGWRAACSSRDPAPAAPGASGNPVGPYLAACLATGFVFKRLFGRPDGIEFSADLWEWRSGPWDGLAVGQEPDGLQLPDAYLLGNGAVGAALAYTLAATPGLRGRLVAVDPQEMSSTDRNRLISGSYDDVGHPKVDLTRRLAEATAIQVYPVIGRWPDDYVTNSRRQVPNDILAQEDEDRFEWILSCVDRNRDRQGIARYLPRHVLAGSTDGLVAQAAYYSMRGRCECLGCNHPVLAPDVLEDLVPKLQNMTRAERGAWLQRRGADIRAVAAIEEYLEAPECGGLGEAELARLGREGEVDWSVGFVSVTAGVLQAAAFIQTVQRGLEGVLGSRSERRLLFWGNELIASAALRRPDCPLCSSPEMQELWLDLWDPRGLGVRNSHSC
jgi:hypothetical protein